MFVNNLPFELLTKQRAVEAFLFDMDGTLIDSKKGIIELVHSFLEAKGLFTKKEKIAKHFGTPIEDLLQFFFPEKESAEIATYVHEIRQSYAENHLQLIKLFLGVRELLQSLKKAGLKVGLASAKFKPFILEALNHFQLADFFDVIASGYEVQRHKPAPDLLLYVAERLHVHPEKCAYVGDSKSDVLAGKAAKMTTILVAATNNYPRALIAQLQPDFIIPSIVNLSPY